MDNVTKRAREMYAEFPVGDWGVINQVRERNQTMLLEFLSLYQEGKTLYDVGCGAGFWMDTYLKRGIPKDKIHGIDLIPRNVETLRARGFDAVVGNVLDLGLEDGVSDFTVSLGVIHITSDPLRALRELVRITKPNGYLYIAVYNSRKLYFHLVYHFPSDTAIGTGLRRSPTSPTRWRRFSSARCSSCDTEKAWMTRPARASSWIR